jgi:DMSO/TMAO reductase YedYZ molybdopterin-dependent catalytic subunit
VTSEKINESETRPTFLRAALAGILAGATAISIAELVAAFNPAWRNPLLTVGDRFVEITPAWLKDFAIATFGTNDKLALLIGIGMFLAAFSALVGVIALRHSLRIGLAGIAIFAVIGVGSVIAGSSGISSALPTLLGSLAAAALLIWFDRGRAQNLVGDEYRRKFLGQLGWATAGVVVIGGSGRFLGTRLFAVNTDGTTLPGVAAPLPEVPAGVGFEVPGLSAFSTSNADFYRIDTALTVPRIDPDTYSIRIFGMVDRELTLTYEELLDRTQVESDITMTCVSNEVGGRLVGNARWQGIRLDELLFEVGVDPAADQVVGRSVDEYTCGFPVEAARDGRDALVAVGMNGQPLPFEHGFPARLIVPGLYGYVSATKWLKEIEITTFDAFDSYWVPRGWAAQAPIKTSSRIDTPQAFNNVSGAVMIAGVAWAQTRGITRVEVRVDGGEWREAELADELNNTTWRQWKLPWDVVPGRHTITCRATDATGELQTEERARPMPDGSTGWHSVVVMGEAA